MKFKANERLNCLESEIDSYVLGTVLQEKVWCEVKDSNTGFVPAVCLFLLVHDFHSAVDEHVVVIHSYVLGKAVAGN